MSSVLAASQATAKKRADDLFKEATDRTNAFTPFGFGRSAANSDAAEKFKMAANQYKLANAYENAGDTFLKASELFKLVDEKLEGTNALVEAAQCYKKDNLLVEKAISTFQLAIEDYNLSGRISRSCQYVKEIAEIYEANENYEFAAQAYEQLSSMYTSDNQASRSKDALLKMATIFADKLQEYQRAAEVYKDVGSKALESNLGKFSAKGHFFNYLLCLTALGDCVAVSQGIETCKTIDYSFGNSRECDFMVKIAQALRDNDQIAYATACSEFDNITPLDPMKTSLLLKGRMTIQDITGEFDEAAELGGEGDGGDDDDIL